MANQGGVVIQKGGKHAVLSFTHPKHNILTLPIISDLTQSIKQLSEDPEIKLIVIESKGENFCAGADLNAVQDIKSIESNIFTEIAALLSTCINSPKPIFCKVQGKAIGGGVGLIAASDYCFAMEGASVRLSELSIGLAPCIIAPLIIKKTSGNFFQKIAWTPTQTTEAKLLKEVGLFQDVYDSNVQLEHSLQIMIKNIEAYNTEAIQQTKRLFWGEDIDWNAVLLENAKKTAALAMSNFES